MKTKIYFFLFLVLIPGCRFFEESAPFTPYKATPYTEDMVISPAPGDIYLKGEILNIKWAGVKSRTVRIDLWKKKAYYHKVIQTDYPNTGNCSWRIPADTESSTYYQVKITSETDTTYFIFSEPFQIR